MTGKIQRLFILSFLITISFGKGYTQEVPWSNEPVDNGDGWEMMPFVKGEVFSHFQVDNPFGLSFSKAQETGLKTRLNQLETAFSAWDKMNPPQGFKVSFYHHVSPESATSEGSSEIKSPTRLTGFTELYFHAYFKNENGEKSILSEVSSGVTLWVNNTSAIAGSPLLYGIYVCPQKTADFFGFPVFQTNRQEVTVISKKGIPAYVPVSQEEYLEALIKYWREKIGEEEMSQQNPENQKSIKSLAGEKEKRRAEMEKAYRELLKYDKNAAEELKKAWQEVEETIAREGAGENGEITGAGLSAQAVSQMNQVIEELKNELNALNQQQKNQQAYYSVGAMEFYGNQSGLVPYEDRDNAEALIKINPALIDLSRPADEIQLLVLQWRVGYQNPDTPRFYEEGKNGFLLADFNMAELHKQENIWKRVFELVH